MKYRFATDKVVATRRMRSTSELIPKRKLEFCDEMEKRCRVSQSVWPATRRCFQTYSTRSDKRFCAYNYKNTKKLLPIWRNGPFSDKKSRFLAISRWNGRLEFLIEGGTPSLNQSSREIGTQKWRFLSIFWQFYRPQILMKNHQKSKKGSTQSCDRATGQKVFPLYV